MDVDPLRPAACPFGLITLRDARRRGVDRFRVAELCRDGALERMAPGLYRIAVDPPPPLQRLAVPQRYLDAFRAASARPTMPSALSGVGALTVRGAFTRADDPTLALMRSLEPMPVVAVPPHRRSRVGTHPFLLRRVIWDHVRPDVVRRLRVVDPAHALADVAHLVADEGPLLDVLDASRNGLRLEVPRLVRRWHDLDTFGARRLVAMARARLLEMESPGERRAFALLFEGRGPLPDCQVTVLGALRADFVFISAGLVIEYHGAVHADRFVADATRRAALEQAGWRVIVIVGRMLRNPDETAAWIHAVRREREHLIRTGTIRRPDLPVQPERLHVLRTLA